MTTRRRLRTSADSSRIGPSGRGGAGQTIGGGASAPTPAGVGGAPCCGCWATAVTETTARTAARYVRRVKVAVIGLAPALEVGASHQLASPVERREAVRPARRSLVHISRAPCTRP